MNPAPCTLDVVAAAGPRWRKEKHDQRDTPEPISVTLELGTGNVRIAASNRTDTVVQVRPSDEADESDVKTAQQVRVDYAGGMLRVTGPKPRAFDFSRKTRSVDVSIELPSGSQVSLETLAGDVHCADRLGDCRLRTSAGNFWLEQTGPRRLKTGFGDVTADSIAGSPRDLHRIRQDPDRRDRGHRRGQEL